MAESSLRRMTKSSRSRPWKLMRPWTASSQPISSSGMLARGQPALHLFPREAAAAAVVAEHLARGLRLAALPVELLPGAEAAVGLPLRHQPLGVGLMPPAVLALEERSLVPGDPEPGEAVENDAGVRLGAALAVRVLDPQDEHAARVPGVEPVEQRGAGAADVEVARG
jgi:hypothetical protein